MADSRYTYSPYIQYEYRYVVLDMTMKAKPVRMLNKMAEDGWRVVEGFPHPTDEGYRVYLMERRVVS